jgi:hypothetical protein
MRSDKKLYDDRAAEFGTVRYVDKDLDFSGTVQFTGIAKLFTDPATEHL